MKKTLLTILGPCACGKSTLGAALLGTEKDFDFYTDSTTFTVRPQNRAGQLQEPRPESVRFCINKKGWALAGPHPAGSDSVNSRAALTALINYLLERRDVKVVMVNSVRFSHQADIFEVKARGNTIRPVYVAFQLSEAENMRRLMARRGGTPLTAHQLENLRRFRHRADRNCEVLVATFGKQLELITLGDRESVRTAVQRITAIISL